MPRPHPRRAAPAAVTALLTTFAALVPLTAPAPAAHAADNGHWSVFPASSRLGSRPYFHLAADPGRRLRDKVTITNRTSAPLTLRLYAADAHNTVRDGGFAVRSPEERQRGVGAWARPDRTRVTVPARGSVTVAYTVTVPDTAPPGDHPGALVALDERVARPGAAVGMGVRQAVGARLYLRVNGPAVPALTVEDVTVDQDRPLLPGTGTSRATVSYTLHNRGNVTLSPRVRLRATGLFGRELLERPGRVPSELLPRQRIRLTERWDGPPALDRGKVRITATAHGTRDAAGASFLAVPRLAAGLLAAALALALLWWRTRRARRTREASGPAAAPV
ncbi:COG1470 family protein [Streptomyces yaizuensis]|uniref:DUF916 domain-containing protein n=1 Tax=Streptomyces yaizuensis TaxID=2989713 RepID=A0ABQ5NUW2_9ACTN|nr:DUF916 domain-containing protein [Streptomyces sp. YSPA8]GLF93786.1 DUF916 domain-containing protein [Streptomyces sp. YSPA8]